MSEQNSRPNNEEAFVGGLIIGGVMGAIAALLYAPRTGKETRRLLKKSLDNLPELADDLSAYLQANADHLSDNARHNWDGTLQRLQEAIAAGIEASQTEAQRLETSTDTEPLVQPTDHTQT